MTTKGISAALTDVVRKTAAGIGIDCKDQSNDTIAAIGRSKCVEIGTRLRKRIPAKNIAASSAYSAAYRVV